MPKQKPQRPRRAGDPTFTEIGGSPVPGLTLRHVFRGHTTWIQSIAWSPDGAYLASSSDDGTILIWDTHDGMCMHNLQGHTADVWSVAWSPDGQRLASAGSDNTICLWEPIASRFIQEVEQPQLLQRRKKLQTRVIPIIVRPCKWQSEPVLKDLQALPRNGKAVIKFSKASGARDEVWEAIATAIEERAAQ